MRGEVVGVNTAIFSPSGGNVGIAFAVPSTVTADVIGDLIENGAVARGWLGVNIQSLTPELAEGIGRESTEGAIIVSAASGSPADDAGLRSGDTILSVNDVTVEGPTELARIIGASIPKRRLKSWSGAMAANRPSMSGSAHCRPSVSWPASSANRTLIAHSPASSISSA
jgi:serine protease Do